MRYATGMNHGDYAVVLCNFRLELSKGVVIPCMLKGIYFAMEAQVNVLVVRETTVGYEAVDRSGRHSLINCAN